MLYCFRKFVILLIISSLCGCSALKWSYIVDEKEFRKPDIDGTLSVLNFKDLRSPNNINNLSLLELPIFVFYATLDVNKMNGTFFTSSFQPSIEFAKITAEEIENSSIFKEVSYSKEAEGDFYLVGKINKVKQVETHYSYGVSILRGYFYLLGLPSRKTESELDIDFQLIYKKTNEVVFEKNYHRYASSLVNHIYYSSLERRFPYATFWKSILSELIADIKERQDIFNKILISKGSSYRQKQIFDRKNFSEYEKYD